MKVVVAMAILGAVAASIAAAMPSGTSGYQRQRERRVRQVIGVHLGDGNFSPTVNIPSSDNLPVNAASSSSPSADEPRIASPSVASSGYASVNVRSSPVSSFNVPNSGIPSVTAPNSGKPYGNVANSPSHPANVPKNVNPSEYVLRSWNPSLNPPTNGYSSANVRKSSINVANVHSKVNTYVNNPNSPAPNGPFPPVNAPTSGNPSRNLSSVGSHSLNALSSGNPTVNVPNRPFSSDNGPTCTMTCQPEQQTVKSDNGVIGVHFGDRNFSPTLNIPSGAYRSVTVGSCACTPTVNMAIRTITCLPQQNEVEHPGRVIGVNIGDGNFSPTLNVPGSGPSTVTLFTCSCSCK